MKHIVEAAASLTRKVSDVMDINKSTLSGAIDVVVVRQPDGSLRSTPFHVRFGKLMLLKPREKIVSLAVNSQPTPQAPDAHTALGEAWEGQEGHVAARQNILTDEPVLGEETPRFRCWLPPTAEALRGALTVVFTPEDSLHVTAALAREVDARGGVDGVQVADRHREGQGGDRDELVASGGLEVGQGANEAVRCAGAGGVAVLPPAHCEATPASAWHAERRLQPATHRQQMLGLGIHDGRGRWRPVPRHRLTISKKNNQLDKN